MKSERLIDFGFRRLEYAKHFSAFLFETERARNAPIAEVATVLCQDSSHPTT
jgi:hypothetical protein